MNCKINPFRPLFCSVSPVAKSVIHKAALLIFAVTLTNKPGMPAPPDPLISVIIPCYNHGQHLPESIKSILEQDYKNFEILVVDDGSAQPVENIVSRFNLVRYIFQNNQGLPAARNTGFTHCKGEYIVFLDADDILYPGGLEANLRVLSDNADHAFVSGCHNVTHAEDGLLDDGSTVIKDQPYVELLRRNYIGMNGAVMYRRWALEKYKFDISLRACEDYDHYLRITRHHPVIHHHVKIAEYRKHGANMSDDPILMYNSATGVLRKQKMLLRNQAERNAYREGLTYWSGKYLAGLYAKLFSPGNGIATAVRLKIMYELKYPFLKMFLRKNLAKFVSQ